MSKCGTAWRVRSWRGQVVRWGAAALCAGATLATVVVSGCHANEDGWKAANGQSQLVGAMSAQRSYPADTRGGVPPNAIVDFPANWRAAELADGMRYSFRSQTGVDGVDPMFMSERLFRLDEQGQNGVPGPGFETWAFRDDTSLLPGGHNRLARVAQTPLRIDVPRLNSGEELMILVRSASDARPAPSDDRPGSPMMICYPPERPGEQAPVPLKHTDVKASIAGALSAVNVTQTFVNPYASKIEAVYVFPLPENAAVNDFVMTIGDRHIRGIIREREEAQRVYNAAKSQGYTASLLTQERPNIFTQSVANIEPGKQVDVSITYYGPLTYVDGALEFVYPMVVGPRYNPPRWAGGRGGVAATPVGAPNQSVQPVEVQYLQPGERTTQDIAIDVDIDAGLPIRGIASPSHDIRTTTITSNTARVTLSPTDRLPNKDFVLRVNVASRELQSGVVAINTERGGFFSVLIVPPMALRDTSRSPVEMVFVLDASGSMNGRPIEQAKEAIERGLDQLESGDTFQLINFANTASALGSRPLEASGENIRAAKRYLDTIQGEGGTEMIRGLGGALDFPHDWERLRYVVMATDGFIGNEPEILAALDQKLGSSRVFSLGIGSSPNRFLMDAMARMGGGFASYLNLNESPRRTMDAFMERVSHAALHDVGLDFGAARVSEVYPSRIPDVYVGRPVMIVGRYDGWMPSSVRITGRAGGQKMETFAPVSNVNSTLAQRALGPLWARAKITELADRAAWSADRDYAGAVRQVALEWSLMSSYTAFVAVDGMQRTAGNSGTTLAVPVPMPEGVRYDTTVGSEREGGGR